MKKLKQTNLKIIIIVLISLLSFQFESFSQIKKYKEKRGFGYLSLQTGIFDPRIIESNNFFGINYRSKLVGNLGLEAGLGVFNANNDYVEAAKKNKFPSNLNSAGSMANGLHANLNINYVIPISGSKFGIIPKFGFTSGGTSSFSFSFDGRRNVGRSYHYTNELRPVAGMDFYINKIIIGSSLDLWYEGIYFHLGYLINNKEKKQK
jgi:hypothetical protein